MDHHHQGSRRDGPLRAFTTTDDRSSLMLSGYNHTSSVEDLLATINDLTRTHSSSSMSTVKIGDHRDKTINGTARPSRSIDREEPSRERRRSVEPTSRTLTNSPYDIPPRLTERSSSSLHHSLTRRDAERSSFRPLPPVALTRPGDEISFLRFLSIFTSSLQRRQVLDQHLYLAMILEEVWFR